VSLLINDFKDTLSQDGSDAIGVKDAEGGKADLDDTVDSGEGEG
jgi:hypothetical protein